MQETESLKQRKLFPLKEKNPYTYSKNNQFLNEKKNSHTWKDPAFHPKKRLLLFT